MSNPMPKPHSWMGDNQLVHEDNSVSTIQARFTAYYHVSDEVAQDFLRRYGWSLDVSSDAGDVTFEHVDSTGRKLRLMINADGSVEEDDDGDRYASVTCGWNLMTVEPLSNYPEHVRPPSLPPIPT